MSRTVIINGREYQAGLAMFGLENELSSGAFPEAIRALRIVFGSEPDRTDVQAAVRAGIEAARAMDPKPRNRHERRALAAQRRREGL